MLSLDSQYDSNIEEDVHLNEYDEEPTEIIACFSMTSMFISLFSIKTICTTQRKHTLVESCITINSHLSTLSNEQNAIISKKKFKIELSAFHELGNNQERDDVMHDNINLLHIRGKNISDYAGQALRCLFARE
ncbi:unnamed protein product [Rotaria socialis]